MYTITVYYHVSRDQQKYIGLQCRCADYRYNHLLKLLQCYAMFFNITCNFRWTMSQQ